MHERGSRSNSVPLLHGGKPEVSEFEKHLTRDPKDIAMHGGDPMAFMVSKAGLKMCLWYGMLYVVVEGWQEAKLSDPEVDILLASPNTELLRRSVMEGSISRRTTGYLRSSLSSSTRRTRRSSGSVV
jgi:hypothetical protein